MNSSLARSLGSLGDKDRPRSAKHVGFCKVDDFIAAPVEHRLDHLETEPDHLVPRYGRRQRELLAVYRHFEQRQSVVVKRIKKQGTHLPRCFRLQA